VSPWHCFQSFYNAQKENGNLLLDRQRDQKRVDSAERTSTSMPIDRKKAQQTKRDATVHPSCGAIWADGKNFKSQRICR
jgi:hypothetical protein